MRGIIFKDDYVGFTYAGKHSSQFGILSVSSGDRYMRTLSPEFSDIVTNVNGKDRTYYFGTIYNRRSFQLNCAFDSITEQEYRELRLWLKTDTISPFTFDETPYVQFFAKVASPPQFSFITFEDEYGDSIVMYRNFDEFEEKLKYYLDHEDERKALAKKAQKITLEKFTNEVAAKKFIEIFKSIKKQKNIFNIA